MLELGRSFSPAEDFFFFRVKEMREGSRRTGTELHTRPVPSRPSVPRTPVRSFLFKVSDFGCHA